MIYPSYGVFHSCLCWSTGASKLSLDDLLAPLAGRAPRDLHDAHAREGGRVAHARPPLARRGAEDAHALEARERAGATNDTMRCRAPVVCPYVERAEGGRAMALFEEMDGWLERTTGGAVDAMFLGCVGGVEVV